MFEGFRIHKGRKILCRSYERRVNNRVFVYMGVTCCAKRYQRSTMEKLRIVLGYGGKRKRGDADVEIACAIYEYRLQP